MIPRGAEAGGILGVNTPYFFGLTLPPPPTFWRDLKMGVREGAQQKVRGGREKFRG